MRRLVEIVVQLFQHPSILRCQILSSAKQDDFSGKEFIEAACILPIFRVELVEVGECEQQSGVVDVVQVPPSVFGAVLEFPEICLLGGELTPDFTAW